MQPSISPAWGRTRIEARLSVSLYLPLLVCLLCVAMILRLVLLHVYLLPRCFCVHARTHTAQSSGNNACKSKSILQHYWGHSGHRGQSYSLVCLLNSGSCRAHCNLCDILIQPYRFQSPAFLLKCLPRYKGDQ